MWCARVKRSKLWCGLWVWCLVLTFFFCKRNELEKRNAEHCSTCSLEASKESIGTVYEYSVKRRCRRRVLLGSAPTEKLGQEMAKTEENAKKTKPQTLPKTNKTHQNPQTKTPTLKVTVRSTDQSLKSIPGARWCRILFTWLDRAFDSFRVADNSSPAGTVSVARCDIWCVRIQFQILCWHLRKT